MSRIDPSTLVEEWRRRASELAQLATLAGGPRAELLEEMAGVYAECAQELASVFEDRGGRRAKGDDYAAPDFPGQ